MYRKADLIFIEEAVYIPVVHDKKASRGKTLGEAPYVISTFFMERCHHRAPLSTEPRIT
jgi:hypothetical protein